MSHATFHTHLVPTSSAQRSACGIKDPLPYVLERFAPAHITGHNMTVCPDCAAAVGHPEWAATECARQLDLFEEGT
jgi:hypothetical protein